MNQNDFLNTYKVGRGHFKHLVPVYCIGTPNGQPTLITNKIINVNFRFLLIKYILAFYKTFKTKKKHNIKQFFPPKTC